MYLAWDTECEHSHEVLEANRELLATTGPGEIIVVMSDLPYYIFAPNSMGRLVVSELVPILLCSFVFKLQI